MSDDDRDLEAYKDRTALIYGVVRPRRFWWARLRDWFRRRFFPLAPGQGEP